MSWEGVTCEYRHSIRKVSLAGGNPRVRIEFSPIKSGPLKDSVSSAHGTEYSPIHTSALACAPCHEYRNPLAFGVLTTYSEWAGGQAAAAGQFCQTCQTAEVAGDVVDPRLQRSREACVNLHRTPGSRSIEQLTRVFEGPLDRLAGGQ